MELVRRRFGEAEVIQIIETEIGGIFYGMIPDMTEEAVERIAWLGQPFRNEDLTLNAPSQAFLIRVAQRLVVVDTCIGNDKTVPDVPDWDHLATNFLDRFSKAGIDPGDVTDVICTHLHVDHVGWNTRLLDGRWVPTFPNATYHFVREEYEFWARSRDESDEHTTQALVFDESVSPIVAAGRANFVDIDADLGDGITLIPTSGHTVAHVCVHVDAGEAKFLIAGDAVHHPAQIAHPEWSTVADYDMAASADTRRDFFERFANSDTWIAGTHFSPPSFGKIVSDAAGTYRFELGV